MPRTTIIAWACSSLVSAWAVASDPALEEKVRSEYPAALARLEAGYARMSGEAVHRKEMRNSGKASMSEIRFARDGALSRSVDVLRSGETDGYSETVLCSNQSYSFRLTRGAPDRPYVIRDLATEDPRRDPEFGRFYFDGFLGAPFVAFGRPIREILALPFKRGEISSVGREGRGLVRIAFEFRPAADFPVVPAWIEVDPEYAWALCRYEGLFGANRNRPRTGSVEYSGIERGRPIVQRVVHTGNNAEETLEVTDIRFDRPLDQRDFTLRAFGLPEVNEKPGIGGSIPLNYWLFGVGGVLLVLSIIIRWSHRKRSAAPAGGTV